MSSLPQQRWGNVLIASRLLKRRQIRNSRPCAIATLKILRRVVDEFKGRDVAKLMAQIRHVGRRLTAAQPREMAIGNVVRRVLGLVREVAEDEHDDMDTPSMSEAGSHTPTKFSQRPALNASISTFSPLNKAATQPADMDGQIGESEDTTADPVPDQRPPLLTSHTSYAVNAPAVTSLFGIFSNPAAASPTSSTPMHASGPTSPSIKPFDMAELSLTDKHAHKDIINDVLQGIQEIGDEIDQCADQIAGYAPDHIHADEIVLVHGMSHTIQKFLLTASRKRRFAVVLVESETDERSSVLSSSNFDDGDAQAAYDSDEETLRRRRTKERDGDDTKPDQLAGLQHKNLSITIIPHSAVFAIMSRINKVLLATHAVLANGGLVASTGAYNIAQAARSHKIPVVVLSGVYKLSPMYPFNTDELVEWGDASAVADDLAEGVEVSNPVKEYVPEGLVDLYITNL